MSKAGERGIGKIAVLGILERGGKVEVEVVRDVKAGCGFIFARLTLKGGVMRLRREPKQVQSPAHAYRAVRAYF